MLEHERKQAICSVSQLNSKKEVYEFIRAAIFCQIWILGFSEIDNPLFKDTGGSGKNPLVWGPEQDKSFK